MQLSRKTDYALRALMTLVEAHSEVKSESGNSVRLIPIRELAERNDAPKAFLEHILLELKQRGWVTSLPGKYGGYKLARDPDTITMGEVVRHFDGVLAPIGCVSRSHYEPCSQEGSCRFRRVLLQVRNQTALLMDHISLATVYKGLPVSTEEVMNDQLLFGGAGI